jgi:hypothetical protein
LQQGILVHQSIQLSSSEKKMKIIMVKYIETFC